MLHNLVSDFGVRTMNSVSALLFLSIITPAHCGMEWNHNYDLEWNAEGVIIRDAVISVVVLYLSITHSVVV